MEINLKKDIDAYILEQNELLKKLETLTPEFKKFNTFIFKIEDCKGLNLEKFDFENTIYLMEIIDFGAFENVNKLDGAKNLLKYIDRRKKENKKIKFPKVNELEEKSNILYIGKSNGNFKTRLQQHLQSSSEKTYALHLCNWEPQKCAGFKICLHYATINSPIFDGLTKNTKKILLEMAETALHQSFKPLLGRTGH